MTIADVMDRMQVLRVQLGIQKPAPAARGADFASALADASTVDGSSADGDAVVADAKKYLGIPYVFGSNNPTKGLDCSGLTMAAWKAGGVSLPHNAASQYNKLPHVAKANIVPGDLVFSNSLGHVSIYVGNGNVIAAPHTGDVVKVQSIGSIGSIVGYGRPG